MSENVKPYLANRASSKPRSAPSTGTALFLLSASPILLLSACSNGPSIQPTPIPPNLAQECSKLPDLPTPLLDPERLIWELEVVALYRECASKQRHLAEAWPR